ncbi:hypothetical protein B0H10DRAFT_2140631, partial [Mycena sp. CBHHK59/15]
MLNHRDPRGSRHAWEDGTHAADRNERTTSRQPFPCPQGMKETSASSCVSVKSCQTNDPSAAPLRSRARLRGSLATAARNTSPATSSAPHHHWIRMSTISDIPLHRRRKIRAGRCSYATRAPKTASRPAAQEWDGQGRALHLRHPGRTTRQTKSKRARVYRQLVHESIMNKLRARGREYNEREKGGRNIPASIQSELRSLDEWDGRGRSLKLRGG